MKRAAIQLSTGFIVSLILGVVLFSLGLVLLFNLLGAAGELEEHLPDSFQIEVENCVQREARVCVPLTKAEIKTNQVGSFGAIVNNIYGEEEEFTLYVEYSTGLLEDGDEAPIQFAYEWTKEEFPVLNLENNEHDTIIVPFRPPKGTPEGNYVFNLNVCYGDDTDVSEKCSDEFPSLWGTTHQVTITVP